MFSWCEWGTSLPGTHSVPGKSVKILVQTSLHSILSVNISIRCSFTNFCSSLYFLRTTGLLPNASQWASICALSAVKVLEDINQFLSSDATEILHKRHSFWNSNDMLINNYWIRFSHDIMRKPNSIIVLLYIFSHNSSSETEAKRSAILFLRRTLQGA